MSEHNQWHGSDHAVENLQEVPTNSYGQPCNPEGDVDSNNRMVYCQDGQWVAVVPR